MTINFKTIFIQIRSTWTFFVNQLENYVVIQLLNVHVGLTLAIMLVSAPEDILDKDL